jgi:hypothetical protein
MAEHLVFHPQLTKADALILEGLRQDINEYKQPKVNAEISSQDGQSPALRQRAANGKPPKGAYSTVYSTGAVSSHVQRQK